jgi:hypothetical protein
MKVLVASEAISPAIERTRRFLFRPFQWGLYLKLAVVACISEGFAGSFNFSFHQTSSFDTSATMPSTLSDELIVLLMLAILACIAIGIAIFYLVTRLRFAFFHCVAHQTKEIRPAWRLYRPQAWRFFKMNLLIAAIFFGVFVLAALPFGFGFYRIYASSKPDGQFDVGSFFLLLLPFIGIVILLCLAAVVVDAVMRDFILPHMAIEDLSFCKAWAVVKARIGTEKGSFAFYLFLRLILPALAVMALFFVAAIPLLIVFGMLALSEAGLNAIRENTAGAVALCCIVFEILLGALAASFGLFVAVCLGGPIATWTRNYALLFYGGRYQALGDILAPPPTDAPAGQEAA